MAPDEKSENLSESHLVAHDEKSEKLSQSYLVAPDKNQKGSVNKRYHLFHSPPLFHTVGSGGALWVQRDSPGFRAHSHLWAWTDLFLRPSSPLSHQENTALDYRKN